MTFLTKNIFDFFSHPFGLDLSDLSVKVVQIDHRSQRGDRVASFAGLHIAPGAIVDGQILKPDVVASAIRAVIKKAGPRKITTNKVFCSLPEAKAFLRIVTIPQMEENEAREAIKWAMEANIPLPIADVYYDWQILEKNFTKDRKSMSVLVVAVARTVVDQFMAVLERAGLDVMGLEIESVAQARSLLDQKEKNKTKLIIDIGDRRTSFLFSVDNTPCFTSSIPLSGEAFTDAIAKTLNLSREDAEKTKVLYGIGSAIKNDHVFAAVQSVVDHLVAEIHKSIDFYVTGLQYSPTVDTILLCGGGARTKGLMPYLSQKLNHTVLLGNPWVNFDLHGTLPRIAREQSVQYSTAIGLALKDEIL